MYEKLEGQAVVVMTDTRESIKYYGKLEELRTSKLLVLDPGLSTKEFNVSYDGMVFNPETRNRVTLKEGLDKYGTRTEITLDKILSVAGLKQSLDGSEEGRSLNYEDEQGKDYHAPHTKKTITIKRSRIK
jgi:hypothetical protein